MGTNPREAYYHCIVSSGEIPAMKQKQEKEMKLCTMSKAIATTINKLYKKVDYSGRNIHLSKQYLPLVGKTANKFPYIMRTVRCRSLRFKLQILLIFVYAVKVRSLWIKNQAD